MVVKLLLALGKEPEVVGVPDVGPYSQRLLDEVVEGVEMDVRQKLAGQVADGQATGPQQRQEIVSEEQRPGELVAQDVRPRAENDAQQLQRTTAADHPVNRTHQDLVVHRGKEPDDVGAQAVPVATHPGVGAVDRHVGAPALAASVRIRDEPALEDRLDHAHDRVMHDPVPERGRRDQPALGLVDVKGAVGAGAIASAGKLRAEAPELGLQLIVELGRARLVTSGLAREPVRRQQVREVRDPVEQVPVPPPHAACLTNSTDILLRTGPSPDNAHRGCSSFCVTAKRIQTASARFGNNPKMPPVCRNSTS
jgi:hypothetical protein